MKKQLGIQGSEFGVNGQFTSCEMQVREFPWIYEKLKAQNSNQQCLKGAAP